MVKIGDCCSVCGHKLESKEDDTRILLLCVNAMCDNYWENKGSEITMVLK
jgi:hypothetical protein